jgi:hypothetical protein
MRLVFKHGTLRKTSERNKQVLTRKYNHKSSIERRETRRSGMRIRLWQQHKKKHLPSNIVKDVIKRDTLKRTIGNCTLRRAPNIFRKKRRRKHLHKAHPNFT